MGDAKKEGDDFEPFDHREVPESEAIGSMACLMHFLKGCIGTGILAMPNVFSKSGMWVGIACMIFFGVLVTYSLHVLFDCQYKACKIRKVGWLSYAEVFEVCLEVGPSYCKKISKYGQKIVFTMFIIYTLGIMTTYVQFVSENIKASCAGSGFDVNLETHMVILLIPFLLMNLIKNLKYMTPLSIMANALTIGTFGIVLYYVLTDLPDFGSRPAIKRFIDLPFFFGTAFFALHSLGIVCSLEQIMKNPRNFRKWNGVLNVAMLIITTSYLGFSVVGYWKYGDKAEASVTLNFPADESLAKACRGLYAIAIYISYSINAFIPVELIWKTYMIKTYGTLDTAIYWEYLMRVCLVLITYVVAVLVPCMGACISLTGAFCLSILAVIYPAIMVVCLHHETKGLWILEAVFLFVVGFSGLIFGSLVAIMEIVTCVRER